MQEYGFIPSIGMSASAFWKQVNDLTDQQQMDNILAYMFLMVQKGREEKNPHYPGNLPKAGGRVSSILRGFPHLVRAD